MVSSTNHSTIHYSCVNERGGTIALIIISLALPFHALIVKILLKDISLSVQRHTIMLSLAVSDSLQIIVLLSANLAIKVFNLTTQSFTCHVVRIIGIFFAVLLHYQLSV